MVITVIGLGFVGLTTALCFSDYGHIVYGYDTDLEKYNSIKSAKVPFSEPNLPESLERNLDNQFFPVYSDEELRKAIEKSDVIYLCVGTPYGENGKADLTYLYSAIDKVLKVISDDKKRVMVIKSTIPPTTTKNLIVPYVKNKNIAIANNPEFLREGHCYEDFMNSDFIIFGIEDEKIKYTLESLYSMASAPVYFVSYNTAEFIKYLSNSSLACLISFANEMSNAADIIGDIDIPLSFNILHSEKRWKNGTIRNYFNPGCGYGGYCLPKDTNAFLALEKSLGFNGEILEKIIAVNDSMAKICADKIYAKVLADINKKIGILGLSFKENSDDIRNTPAAGIITELENLGFNNIYGYDPIAINNFKNTYSLDIEYIYSLDEITDKAEVLVIVTAWPEFSVLKDIKDKIVIDLRNML